MNSSRTRQAAAITFATARATRPSTDHRLVRDRHPSIESKRAQAQAVLAQIHESDIELEQAIESYNYANIQLEEIDDDLSSNARHLVVAQKSLGAAQVHIADRLRALYVNGDGGGAVEILLGAQNLDDLLGRLDMVQRVGDQDAKVLKEVQRFRKEVKARRATLKNARAEQARIVAERASQKQWIESQLAERERMLAGIQSEIRAAPGRGGRPPAQVEAQARARLAAQQRLCCGGAGRRPPTSPPPTSPRGWSRQSSEAVIPAPSPSQYGGVVGIAMQYLGVPYVWGGMSPGGFDCSGLVAYAYAQLGVSLPHNAAAMYSYGTPVSYYDLQAGDLVFFSGLGHMGLYIGGGQFVHAPHTGDVVKISSMSDRMGGYVGARRL